MKRSTRLVYLHQYYKSAAEVGGIRSHEFAKRLAAAGYDVHMVTTNRGADGQPGWSGRMSRVLLSTEFMFPTRIGCPTSRASKHSPNTR